MFSLGGAVNSGADWVCGLPIVRGIITNSVYTALLITALVVIVALGVYRAQLAKAGTRKALRATLYLFFLVTAVMFIHQYTLTRAAHDTAAAQNVRDVFAGIEQSRTQVGGSAFASPPFVPSSPFGGLASLAPPQSFATSARPDNIHCDSVTSLDIEDVVVPATIG